MLARSAVEVLFLGLYRVREPKTVAIFGQGLDVGDRQVPDDEPPLQSRASLLCLALDAGVPVKRRSLPIA